MKIIRKWLQEATLMMPIFSFAASTQAAGLPNASEDLSYRIRTSASASSVRVAVTESGEIIVAKAGASWRVVDTGVLTFFRDVIFQNGNFVAIGGSYLTPSGAIVTSTDGEHWLIRRCGIKTVLRGIAYGSGKFVAVGDRGTIMTSATGEYWRSERSPMPGLLASVAYANGHFHAQGEGGSVTSHNGTRWTFHNLDSEGKALAGARKPSHKSAQP